MNWDAKTGEISIKRVKKKIVCIVCGKFDKIITRTCQLILVIICEYLALDKVGCYFQKSYLLNFLLIQFSKQRLILIKVAKYSSH